MSKNNARVIFPGQIWRKLGDAPNATWTVVSVSVNGYVGITGPGVCRSYHTIEDEELIQDWELVTSL